jgi:hypothetical protein
VFGRANSTTRSSSRPMGMRKRQIPQLATLKGTPLGTPEQPSNLVLRATFGRHRTTLRNGSLTVGRTAESRYTILVMATTIVMWVDKLPTFMGTPVDNR